MKNTTPPAQKYGGFTLQVATPKPRLPYAPPTRRFEDRRRKPPRSLRRAGE